MEGGPIDACLHVSEIPLPPPPPNLIRTDDKRNGRGVFTIAETGDKYEGEWMNGKVCG